MRAESEEAGHGFLNELIGGIGSGLKKVATTVQDAGGKLKFWEGNGDKSPRHHFNEGEIFKGMFGGSSDVDAPVPFSSMGMPGAKGATAANTVGMPPPCIRANGAPSSKEGCNVKFDVVRWRNHEVEMDGSGGLPSSGIPLGIGWKVESEKELGIDEFEAEREPIRRNRDLFMMEGFVPPKERVETFHKVGYTKEEISACELATFKVNRRRKASVQDLSDMDL